MGAGVKRSSGASTYAVSRNPICDCGQLVTKAKRDWSTLYTCINVYLNNFDHQVMNHCHAEPSLNLSQPHHFTI